MSETVSDPVLSNPAHAQPLPSLWRMPTTTCGHCGAPRVCCGGGTSARTAGASGHGEPAEGEEGGEAADRATEAASGVQGQLFTWLVGLVLAASLVALLLHYAVAARERSGNREETWDSAGMVSHGEFGAPLVPKGVAVRHPHVDRQHHRAVSDVIDIPLGANREEQHVIKALASAMDAPPRIRQNRNFQMPGPILLSQSGRRREGDIASRNSADIAEWDQHRRLHTSGWPKFQRRHNLIVVGIEPSLWNEPSTLRRVGESVGRVDLSGLPGIHRDGKRREKCGQRGDDERSIIIGLAIAFLLGGSSLVLQIYGWGVFYDRSRLAGRVFVIAGNLLCVCAFGSIFVRWSNHACGLFQWSI
jgi:hypothetical protein